MSSKSIDGLLTTKSVDNQSFDNVIVNIVQTSEVISLDTNDDIKTTANVECGGFKLSTGATDGYVLTSDANGVGTWEEAKGGVVDNIYTADGTLTGNRTITGSGNTLTIDAPLVYTGTTPTDGYYLKSDASGNASWQAVVAANQVSLDDGALGTPSLRFINDTDTGISRNISGSIVFSGNTIPTGIFTPDNFSVNNQINTQNIVLSDVKYSPPSPLGTILTAYPFSGISLTSSINNPSLNFDVANMTKTSLLAGRVDVAQSTGSGSLVINTTPKLNVFSSLADFSISIWFYLADIISPYYPIRIGQNLISSNEQLTLTVAGTTGILTVRFNTNATTRINYNHPTPLVALQWYHVVINTGSAGFTFYLDNVKYVDEPTVIQSLSSLQTFNTFSTPAGFKGAVDDIVITTNNLDATLVNGLYTDAYTFTGLPSFEPVSKITYDTLDSRSKLQLADNTDILTFDATDITIPHPLKYTGATPSNGYLLTCDASGNASWEFPRFPTIIGGPNAAYVSGTYNITGGYSKMVHYIADNYIHFDFKVSYSTISDLFEAVFQYDFSSIITGIIITEPSITHSVSLYSVAAYGIGSVLSSVISFNTLRISIIPTNSIGPIAHPDSGYFTGHVSFEYTN